MSVIAFAQWRRGLPAVVGARHAKAIPEAMSAVVRATAYPDAVADTHADADARYDVLLPLGAHWKAAPLRSQ